MSRAAQKQRSPYKGEEPWMMITDADSSMLGLDADTKLTLLLKPCIFGTRALCHSCLSALALQDWQ